MILSGVQWRKWGRTVLDLVYPLRCPGCRAALPAGADLGEFCLGCDEQVRGIEPPFCHVCSEPFPGDIPGEFTCPNCAGRRQAFDFSVCRWLSRGPVREAIHRLKYEREPSLRLPLAKLMMPALQDVRLADSAWLMVPVPLHPRKKRERQYNQSAELARTLSRLTGVPWCDALRRVRYTHSQAGLDREGRLKNLKGAFGIAPRFSRPLAGRDILLIDDVLTTGATAHECALTLKSGGVGKVVVLTVARG